MTSGRTGAAPPDELRRVVALYQTALGRAQYVWLTGNTAAQIPWDRQLSVYFHRHFRLIGLARSPTGDPYVPTPGIYARTSPAAGRLARSSRTSAVPRSRFRHALFARPPLAQYLPVRPSVRGAAER